MHRHSIQSAGNRFGRLTASGNLTEPASAADSAIPPMSAVGGKREELDIGRSRFALRCRCRVVSGALDRARRRISFHNSEQHGS